MARVKNPNLDLLMLAVDQLGGLSDEMIFVGGCATGLLITDLAAPPIRVTRDVDAIVQVVSRVEYYQLSEKLREQGFKEDASEDAPICRWVSENVILDVMPTDKDILGFGNDWYAPAAENADLIQLPSGKQIKMVSAPYFLITKLLAFEGRGGGDYLMSHDIEDIIAVIDGRAELLSEVFNSDENLIKALSERFSEMLENAAFIDAISGHMPTDEMSQARVSMIKEVIEKLSHNKIT
ncbi:MAG: hypothetical protein QM500_03010 [Methylococcales bacterium]